MASADGENGCGIDGGDAEPQLSLSASPSLSGDVPGDAEVVEQRAPGREQQRGKEDEQQQPRCVKKTGLDSTAALETAERSEKLDLVLPHSKTNPTKTKLSTSRPAAAAASTRPAIYDELENDRAGAGAASGGRRSDGSNDRGGGGNDRSGGNDRWGDRRGGRRSPPPQQQRRRSSPRGGAKEEDEEAVYIPPFKLARLLGDATDREGEAFQRLSWEALRKVKRFFFHFFLFKIFDSFFLFFFSALAHKTLQALQNTQNFSR